MTFEEFIEKNHAENLSDYVRYKDVISWVDEYNDYLAKTRKCDCWLTIDKCKCEKV